MTTVNNTTQTSSVATTNNATMQAANDAQDRFLKLLVTQMQNQDPLNPLDNAEVTSQMAQISTVTGISQLNTSMESLSSMLQAAKTMQATSMIGHSVFAEGSSLTLSKIDDSTQQAFAGFSLPEDATSVTVEILDEGGAVLQTKTYNDVPAGINNFSWDGSLDKGGTAAAGNYSFRITAVKGTTEIESTPLAMGLVNSVSLVNGQATLNVSGLGEISLDSVQQVL